MKMTRAEVEATIRMGDVVCVIYRKTNGVAKLLRWAEGGRSSHTIECLGGLDTVEETIGGGMRTSLYTYLRGNCDLFVKRAPKPIHPDDQARIRSYWLSLVGKGYGWDSIKRAAVTMPIRRFIKPNFPRLARFLIEVARLLLPGKMPDCSAAWVNGIRLSQPDLFYGYEAAEVDPQTVLRNPELITVARWLCPVLEDA